MLIASPTPARLARLITVLLVLSAASTTLGFAQEVVPPDHPAIRGSLAMRFGEAADAHRTGEPIWILADRTFPHEVYGVYDDPRDAPSVEGHLLSGPYVTPPDFGRSAAGTVVCWHMKRPYSRYVCSGTMGFPALMPEDIESFTFSVTTKDGNTYPLTFSPNEVDAIFLSVSAFDRFVAPYYTRSYGVDYAKRIRDEILGMEYLRER